MDYRKDFGVMHDKCSAPAKLSTRIVTLLIAILSLSPPAHAADDFTVIHAGTLIDGLSGTPRHDVSIVVRKDRIVEVINGFIERPDHKLIDLSTATVLPGFIDCHVHVGMKLPSKDNALADRLTHSVLDRAFDAAAFARTMLQQGFTSVRDVGGRDDSVAVRDAITRGRITGPRLWAALEPLSPTAGHGDFRRGLDPALANPAWMKAIVDTPDQARIQVRDHRLRGADLIKIMPSDDFSADPNDPLLMTSAEISTVVQTAHALRMKVAAHAFAPRAIEAAVLAGVDSIEHGSFGSDRSFALMKAHGTYLVPTLSVFALYSATAREHPDYLPRWMVDVLLPYGNQPTEAVRRALKVGIKIAYGTDLGEGDHSTEFALLMAAGMRPMEAIEAATSHAADLIGASDDVGTVQPGRFADIIAVDGDPLTDVTQFGKVQFVMKGGVIYRDHGVPTNVQ